MADILDREAKEAALAAAVASEFSRARTELVRLVPEMSTMLDVDPAFWTEHEKALILAISPRLQDVFMSQAETFMDDFTFLGVDWGLVNTAAVDWSSRYTFDLVTGVNNTSRRYLQSLLSGYFEQPMTIGQLRDSLTRIFGPVRAEMIAVTEVTRAAAEGERETVRQLASEGITMRAIWQTNNDELVCTICGPKHGKEITDGEYPPAHPRCRCFVSHEMVSDGE